MPLDTRQYDFEEEIADLEAQIDDLADQVAEMDPTSERAKSLESRGNTLDTYRRGLEWAAEEWDVDAVELGGLNAGEYGRMQDELPEGGGGGATRIYYVASGTVDAPYVADDLETSVANVAQLPIAYAKWAEAQINDLTSVGGDEGNRFYASLAERRTGTTSTETSGPTTS